MPNLKEKVIQEIRKVYDPEIPVNIYELGLIYKIEIELKVDQPICFSIQQKIEAERHKCGEIFLCKTVHLQIFSSPIHHSEAKQAKQHDTTEQQCNEKRSDQQGLRLPDCKQPVGDNEGQIA